MNILAEETPRSRTFTDKPSYVIGDFVRTNDITTSETPRGLLVDAQYFARTFTATLRPFGHHNFGYDVKRGGDSIRLEIANEVERYLNLRQVDDFSVLHNVI